MGEPQNENDLFFVCSFIEYISRKTKNKKSYVVEKIDNYNSSMYYENPDYIYECYKEGKVL